MWSNVIAVLGTLAGCLVTGVVQARVTRVERRESRRDSRRAEALGAVTALVAALADHRRARVVVEERRLSGADAESVEQARDAARATRAAVTVPLTTVSILIPALADAAREATQAAYAMRHVPDHAALEKLRADAVATSDRLVEAAAVLFAAVGGVVGTKS